ncbi:hypothetical protein EWF20_07755 [Sulfolobus sp. S-194]|uniref:hypothetical protein n=1 Tax=Sulfolobus sp. S-194 TaxID=2512240 RepID=UPI00143701ED|nr:hypothetical protein [Sulfolobus sp. S-194]QIW24050.1 hypothetical protein EWF20_07755 [Sulfolobus sp. S-194]
MKNVSQIEPIYKEIYQNLEMKRASEIVCEAGPGGGGLYSSCWHIQDFKIPKPNNIDICPLRTA